MTRSAKHEANDAKQNSDFYCNRSIYLILYYNSGLPFTENVSITLILEDDTVLRLFLVSITIVFILTYLRGQWQSIIAVTDLLLSDVFFSNDYHGWISGRCIE